MMRKLSVLGIGAILALVLGAGTARAASITGGVSFGGSFLPTGGTGLSDATGVDILSDIAVVSCAISSSCQGSYAGVTGLVGATYHDFTFAPLGGGTTPLWTFTFGGLTYSFDLSSVHVVEQTASVLGLVGTGILHITGFADTPGQFSFSGDTSGAVFAFSSTASAPEPASTLLLGLALLGGVRAYRRRSA